MSHQPHSPIIIHQLPTKRTRFAPGQRGWLLRALHAYPHCRFIFLVKAYRGISPGLLLLWACLFHTLRPDCLWSDCSWRSRHRCRLFWVTSSSSSPLSSSSWWSSPSSSPSPPLSSCSFVFEFHRHMIDFDSWTLCHDPSSIRTDLYTIGPNENQ